MKKIGVFGGTFNPAHNGHLNLARQIKEKAGLDFIIIIPTYAPPHKASVELISGEDRLQICRKTFTDKYFLFSDIELKRKGKSYTYDTLTALQQQYPDDKFYLIIGSDMLLSFHQWYRYKDILSQSTLCVCSRSDGDGYKKMCDYAAEVLHLDHLKGEIVVLDISPIELSSTEIRNKIKGGEDVSKLVAPSALRYIFDKGLYK